MIVRLVCGFIPKVMIGSLLVVTSFVQADEKCTALLNLELDDTVITAAGVTSPSSAPEEISTLAGKPNVFGTSTITLSKPFCRVTATIKSTVKSNIKIEVWLPSPDQWNGKYLGTGNGGAAGRMLYTYLASGLERGYATAHTDMGTSTPEGPPGFDFGVGELEKVKDWSWRSTHLMTVKAKKIVSAYYRESSKNSYFYGCSTGGHQALAEAQKYPQDYDGIIAGAPAHNRTNLHMSFLWAANAWHQAGLTPADAALVNRSVLQACDGMDGIVDGVLDDPRRCQFDPGQLLCGDDSNKSCLNSDQVDALRKIYSGPVDPATGQEIYPGITPGSESGLWWLFKPYQEMWGKQGGLLGWSNSYQWENNGMDFDFDKDAKQFNESLGPLVNYTDAELTGFRKRGGKLLLSHGWADSLIPAQDLVNYYEQIEGKAGSREEARKFARLFTVPGLRHCSRGPGPNRFDLLSALDRWVSTGQPPKRIVATKFRDDDPTQGVAKTRPLCAYPKVARWNGTGSVNSADNFSCVSP